MPRRARKLGMTGFWLALAALLLAECTEFATLVEAACQYLDGEGQTAEAARLRSKLADGTLVCGTEKEGNAATWAGTITISDRFGPLLSTWAKQSEKNRRALAKEFAVLLVHELVHSGQSRWDMTTSSRGTVERPAWTAGLDAQARWIKRLQELLAAARAAGNDAEARRLAAELSQAASDYQNYVNESYAEVPEPMTVERPGGEGTTDRAGARAEAARIQAEAQQGAGVSPAPSPAAPPSPSPSGAASGTPSTASPSAAPPSAASPSASPPSTASAAPPSAASSPAPASAAPPASPATDASRAPLPRPSPWNSGEE